ncbi:MAG: hypothetical protein ACOX8A_08305 [Thermacetogeniaceae bacterium]|jgi:hypothetical protein
MFKPQDHLIDLKGKSYLQVMWRLVWFREEHPVWGIDTQMVSHDTENYHCVFKAIIYDENGVQKSCGYGSESAKDFRDYIEKAETKAVGRALAMLGYGTQFAPELDEGQRIADSPVKFTPKKKPQNTDADPLGTKPKCSVCGQPLTQEMAVTSKKKYGKLLCPICKPY